MIVLIIGAVTHSSRIILNFGMGIIQGSIKELFMNTLAVNGKYPILSHKNKCLRNKIISLKSSKK